MAQRVVSSLMLCALLTGVCALPSFAVRDDLRADEVFAALEMETGDGQRREYLQGEVGKYVEGTGFIVKTQSRSSFDSAIPPTNRIVALIVVDADHRVICGLPEGYMGGELRGFAMDKSFEVQYRGKLADGQVWEGKGTALYLYDCAEMRVIVRKNRMRQIPEEYLQNASWGDK